MFSYTRVMQPQGTMQIYVAGVMLAQPMSTFIAKIQNFDTSAYMLGWGVVNFDANYTLFSLVHTKTTGAAGSFNLGRISDPKLDAIIAGINVELDVKKREARYAKVE